MIDFKQLPKLKAGDKVAILSPSFAAPGQWPHIYELGLQRLIEVFDLEPVEYATTSKIGASAHERVEDIISAFSDKDIKGVITSLGGNDQVTYVWKLLEENKDVFRDNPKPFFGCSDNTHLTNFLWLNGVPSYYGGALFTEFAMQSQMDEFTVEYLKKALFVSGELELKESREFNDQDLSWNDESLNNARRRYQKNEGWYWDGEGNAEGLLWGGCIESIDEILRHGQPIPSLEQFKDLVLVGETSEEMPESTHVSRVFRALGERGILSNVKGILIGRPKAWEFNKQNSDEQKEEYKKEQRDAILKTVRIYNKSIPVVQNLDFGHTAPQIPMPLGNRARIDSESKKIFVQF